MRQIMGLCTDQVYKELQYWIRNFQEKSTNYFVKSNLIAESLNLKRYKQQKSTAFGQIEDRSPYYNDSLSIIQRKDSSSIQLPNIFSSGGSNFKQLISIKESQKLIRKISENLNFINRKTAVLNESILKSIHQNTKPVPYSSSVYQQQLTNLNLIFNGCGIQLKIKDVLVLEGESSKTKYSFFTNQQKHPQSLCCKQEVVFKHISFLSSKKFLFQRHKSIQKPLKSLILIECSKCACSILKIRPIDKDEINNKQLSQFQQQRRLLNFSKLISSGRFKKKLINDESVQLMNSRLMRSLDRSLNNPGSKTKLQELSVTREVKNHKRYQLFQKDNRVKSQQTTINVLQKRKQLSQQLRNNNISTILLRSQYN